MTYPEPVAPGFCPLSRRTTLHRSDSSSRKSTTGIAATARRGGVTRRGFSLAEVLISLAITGTLLTATLSALDASFKSYKVTTEGASTNVVSRMVVQRIMSMIRTGTEFGPYPADVLDQAQNPVESDFVEFVASDDGVTRKMVRIEARDAEEERNGPRELWYVLRVFVNGVETAGKPEERPLITGVAAVSFKLEYDVGPRLRRATVDMTIKPNDFQDASFGGEMQAPVIRLVSTVAPRRLD